MNSELYMIANRGCDDTTYCVAQLPKANKDFLSLFFEYINQNSTYGCMPKIEFCNFEEVEVSEEDMVYMTSLHIVKYKGKYYRER